MEKNINLTYPTADCVLQSLGYNLEFEHSNEIVYKKQMLNDICIYIKIWKSQDDTYILKYSSANDKFYKFSLDEFEVVHLLLIEKWWL